jgi:hypothetical protein
MVCAWTSFVHLTNRSEIGWLSERCTKQSAPIAVRNVPFRSNLILADRSTVETAGQSEEGREEDIRLFLTNVAPKKPFPFLHSLSTQELSLTDISWVI